MTVKIEGHKVLNNKTIDQTQSPHTTGATINNELSTAEPPP